MSLSYDIMHNATGTAILAAGLYVSHVSGYTRIIWARGGVMPNSFPRMFLGLADSIAMFALYGWSFINRPWWLAVALFLSITFFATPFTLGHREKLQRRIIVIYRIQPLLDLFAVTAAAFLWWAALR